MRWILSANRSGARVLELHDGLLTLVETIHHPRGRLRDREINSDEQGRTFEGVTGARHALSRSDAAHEHDAQMFAKLLASRLREDRLAGRFERLILVAEPHMLGMVRDALDAPTAGAVVASVPKDLERVPVHELASWLPA